MTAFALSCLLSACNPTVEPTPDVNTFVKSDLIKTYELGIEGQNYALVGDTTLPKQETPLHTAPTKPNLSSISNNTVFKYVAIGASLTAGVRDGGWTNDGMLTSYPNLIARQMGIDDFKQPYFNENEFNGYGLKLPTPNTETPVARYKAVSNNLAFKPSGVEMILTPYEGTELNNFAVPNLGFGGLNTDLKINNFDNKVYKLYFNRVRNGVSIQSSIEASASKISFFTIELFTQDLINYSISGGNTNFSNIWMPNSNPNNPPTSPEEKLLATLTIDKKAMGIILNIPKIINLPYFTKSASMTPLVDNILRQNGYETLHNQKDLFMPNPFLDSLFITSSKTDKTKLYQIYYKKILSSDNAILYRNAQERLEIFNLYYNDFIAFLSKKYSYPVVDIKGLYEKISNNTFISNEGRKVTEKEFFSSDGLYPSAYGQAIIANECIKTINTYYKTNISLIRTDYYLYR